MSKCIVYLEGTADTDFSGIAYSNMNAVLCFNKEKKEYYSSLAEYNSCKFDNEEDAIKAFNLYKKAGYSRRNAIFEISFLS